MFDLELIDASGLFTVEPKSATGSTNVAIRLANGPLDYENPNHQKFILVVSKQLQHPDKTFSFFTCVLRGVPKELKPHPPNSSVMWRGLAGH